MEEEAEIIEKKWVDLKSFDGIHKTECHVWCDGESHQSMFVNDQGQYDYGGSEPCDCPIKPLSDKQNKLVVSAAKSLLHELELQEDNQWGGKQIKRVCKIAELKAAIKKLEGDQ